MSSSTSGHGSSEPLTAADAEQLPARQRELVYGPGLVFLWIGILAGPFIWAADLLVAYLLVYRGCHTRNLTPLYAETVLVLALAAAAVWLSWRMLGQFRGAHGEGGQPDDRGRFLAVGAVALSALFLLVLVAAAIPRVVLDPCL